MIRPFLRFRNLSVVAPVALAVVLFVPASPVRKQFAGGKYCTQCHEMRDNYQAWTASTHRSVSCAECHGSTFSLDIGFQAANARRLFKHLSGDVPDQPELRFQNVLEMTARCAKCHHQEFARWQSGPHSATYQRIFADKKHNTERRLMDDCLRCHGMHFDGGIRDLVTPVNTKGPWELKRPDLAQMPTMPCLACHQMHTQGQPQRKGYIEEQKPGPRQPLAPASLALFDRREQQHFSVKLLPSVRVFEGARAVKMSPDQRQALCYQCHAPLSTMQVASGDDRTPIGVHEGLSCLACHDKHAQTTRASCATCHPRLSNCGLDVEKMDTTFASRASKHNIHFVKCIDCHEKGVPKRRRAPEVNALASGSGNSRPGDLLGRISSGKLLGDNQLPGLVAQRGEPQSK